MNYYALSLHKQHVCRSACVSAPLIFTAWIDIASSSGNREFESLNSFSKRAVQYVSYHVGNPEDRFAHQ